MFRMEPPDSVFETVTYEQFEAALRVWCTVAPKRMWRDFIYHSETRQKWAAGADPFDRFNPNHAFAEYLVGKLRQAGWEIRQPVRGGAFHHGAG